MYTDMDMEGWSDQSKVEIRLMVSRITSFLEEIENEKNVEGSGSQKPVGKYSQFTKGVESPYKKPVG